MLKVRSLLFHPLLWLICLSSVPQILEAQWTKYVGIIGLHDSTFSARREAFSIRTYGDSGVSIFGAAYYSDPYVSFSTGIEANVDPSDGSFLKSSAPSGLTKLNGRYSQVAFTFPELNRVLVHHRILENSSQSDSIHLRKMDTDSTLSSFEGNWQVVNHQKTGSSTAWIYRNDSSLYCKKINLSSGLVLQSIDLSAVLNDSLFGDQANSYSLKNLVEDGANLILEYSRANPGFIDPVSGSYFVEQAILSIDTSSLSVKSAKYFRAAKSDIKVYSSGENERILSINERSFKDVTDTTITRSLVLEDYSNSSTVSLSYRTRYYISIFGHETIPGHLIYEQNGFYLIYMPILNFPPNGRVLDGVRLVLFDSTGQLYYDLETANEWLNLYFNQVRISKRGEVYFNIQEERPSDNIILGKIDLKGNNPLFKKSPLSTELNWDQDQVFAFFPNPASNYLEVVSNSDMENIELINSRGELVYTARLKGRRFFLETQSMARGIYIVRLKTQLGTIAARPLVLR